jgi:hypothetical protein
MNPSTAPGTMERGAGPFPAPPSGGRVPRRRSALIGAVVGLGIAVAVAGYWVYDRAATPARPAVETAPTEEVIAFIINKRGLTKLPKFEQDQFLMAWKAKYSQDAEQRALKKHLESAPEEDRAAVRDVLYRIARRQFFEDARAYAKIQEEGGNVYAFLAGKLVAGAAETAWLKGNGDPGKDLTGVMAAGLPRNPEDVTKLIVSDTTPEERVIGERYIAALKDVREQEKRRAPR